MAFNLSAAKPTFSFSNPSAATSAPSLFSTTSTTAPQNQGASSSLFSFNNSTANKPAATSSTMGFNQPQPSMSSFTGLNSSLNQNPMQQQSAPSSQAQIDLNHIRATTKFDHLTPALQEEISQLDRLILASIQQSNEVHDLLDSVRNAAAPIDSGVEFVSGKIEEVESGLENDAEVIIRMRDTDLKRAQGEAKCTFRAVDRLKMPRQYQYNISNSAGSGPNPGAPNEGVYGGSGLSGWWNHPQVLRGSVRGGVGGGGYQSGTTMLLPSDEDNTDDDGPKSLIDLFSSRIEDMQASMTNHKALLAEIEDFVEGLDAKVHAKERQLNERQALIRSSNGDTADSNDVYFASERDEQMQLLRYVFGEVQRSLYDVAAKVGETRDGVLELGLGRG